jgi:lysophospholipase L1-like esterase
MRIIKKSLILVLASLAVALGGYWYHGTRSLNAWPMVNAQPAGKGILCFGDSLVAGRGADEAKNTYPAQLERLTGVNVLASGVSGETSEDGLKRLQKTRGDSFGIAVVTLGGNDILRKIPWETTQKNLAAIFREFQSRGALVVFTAVEGPLGGREKRYRQLCKEHGVVMVPNILKGILSDPELKADMVHPNSAGYRVVAERIQNVIRPFL